MHLLQTSLSSLACSGKSACVCMCRLAILAMNGFCNKSNTDNGDELPNKHKNEVMALAHHISKENRKIFIKFVNDFTLSVHATYGIQFVRAMEGLDAKVEVCQVFLMLGLGMSRRMKNCMTHIFFGRSFQHNACMPLCVVNDQVHFEQHAFVHVVNWGATGAKKKS